MQNNNESTVQDSVSVPTHCLVCRGELDANSDSRCCVGCNSKYPASLLKSIGDPFDYALQLRTGLMIRFRTSSIDGEFAHLTGVRVGPMNPAVRFDDRGIDIRLTDIVWFCDEGS
jgi:hypothetical protein